MDVVIYNHLSKPIRSVDDWADVPPRGHRNEELELARSWIHGDGQVALRALLDRDDRTAGLVIGSGQVRARKAIRQPPAWRYHDLLVRGVVASGPIIIAMRAERRAVRCAVSTVDSG